ncbi:MAG: hypothetical protein GC164_09410 [Phycisphaera sp.]|nr:hypothetical protein [Phycisphaera sp.]
MRYPTIHARPTSIALDSPRLTRAWQKSDSPATAQAWYTSRNDTPPTVQAGYLGQTYQSTYTVTYDRESSSHGRVYDSYHRHSTTYSVTRAAR